MHFKEAMKHIWNSMFVSTSIKPLKFVLFFENILCVYRNLAYYKSKWRIVVYFRIAIEILLTIICIIAYSIYELPLSSKNSSEFIYFYVGAVNSIVVILLACYTSGMFENLLSLIESIDTYFGNDVRYKNNMSKQNSIIKYRFFIWMIVMFVLEAVQYFRNKDKVNAPTNIANFAFFIYVNICNCRYIYEHVALYAILYVMSEQLECITRAISKTNNPIATGYEQNEDISDEDNDDIQIDVKEFEELSTIFSNIKRYSKLFNKIYGLQMTLMLGSATSYCIMFLYTLTFLSVKGYHDIINLSIRGLKLLIFIMLLVLPPFGAQKKQNNVQNLRRQLGKLLVKCVTNDPQYKATKDFLRLVSMRSLKTETLGSIDVDMSLLPSLLMFITSYTVIALQFNNIV